MGMMIFRAPEQFDAQALEDLARAYLVTSPDYMPVPTTVRVQDRQLIARRDSDDTGALVAPWPLPGKGGVFTSSGTLLERSRPYDLALELARGKVNQLHGLVADWGMHGLVIPPTVRDRCRSASSWLIRGICEQSSIPRSQEYCAQAIAEASAAGDQLVGVYTEQAIAQRMEQQPRLAAVLAFCVSGRVPTPTETALLCDAFNAVNLNLAWGDFSLGPGKVEWERADAVVHWAVQQNFALSAGPLIDFAPAQLPSWMDGQHLDADGLAAVARDYVGQVVRRYKGDITVWQAAGAGNWAGLPPLGEDDLVSATALALSALRQTDPKLRLVLGLGQPWGEYLARGGKQYSPLVFADSFLRSNLSAAALELEVVMGVRPRGSGLRQVADFSRLLDLYSLLGLPLRVRLACPGTVPSLSETLPATEGGLEPVGEWSTASQADWAAQFASLALAKPAVEAVTWLQLHDSGRPGLPGCGLFDMQGNPRPALSALAALRKQWLR